MEPKITEDDYAVYPYGSRVYGTAQEHSDWDYVVIRENAKDGEIRPGLINLKMMSPAHFQKLLDEHRITALECFFLPEDKVLRKPSKPWVFKLDKKTLRRSISEKSSHSWVKARKKFISPYNRANEMERGKKSLFHSLRIIMFGIQIARDGHISDYSEANYIFEDIMTDPSISWENYEKQWKKARNELLTKFRTLAPKE